jgi:hypothetical protein
MLMLKIVFGVIASLLLIGFFLGKGESIPKLSSWLPASSDTPVIYVASSPEQLFVSNDTEFAVGERLYFRLHYAGGPPKMFWRLEGHIVQRGIAFDTSDLKDLNLEALERRSIPTGSFLIEAFVFDGEAYRPAVKKTISFEERDKRYPRSMGRHKQYEATGSISYKEDKVMIMEEDSKVICTINARGAPVCPK